MAYYETVIRVALLGIVLSLVGSLPWGSTESSTLHLGFRNSVTGESVVPNTITIEALGESGTVWITDIKSDAYGRAQGDFPPGSYRITATVIGMGTQSAETVIGKVTPSITFNFDPSRLPQAADPARIQRLVKANSFTVTGFVVDDLTGRVIPGLRVNGNPTANDGSFVAYLPLSGNPILSVSGGDYGEVIYTNFETWPGGDIQLRVRARRGEGQTIDLRSERRRGDDDPMSHVKCDSCSVEPDQSLTPHRGAVGPALPKSIRVGRNCPTATTCSSVEVYSVQAYTARVLSSEWYGCWGSVSGGMDSMRAGAVAVRSYGVYHVYNPRTSTYDICDTTSCQVFGASTNTNSQNATNDTNRTVLTNSSGTIVRAEYSAENNDSGCGDGFTGTGTSGAPCISDPVCSGFAQFGHGRGLCQWGSARWATQKVLSSSQACTSSAPNTNQPRKDWIEILNHYYPSYNLVTGAELTLSGITASPSGIIPGGSTQLQYNINSTADVNNVWLIATLSLNGTGPAVTNTANQVRVNLNTGSQIKQRTFATSSSLPPGTYSAIGALHYDRDGSNTFNAGDFLMADGSFAGALSVTVPADPTTMIAFNATGRAGTTVQLRGLLREPDGTPIGAQIVSFTVNGISAGSATTTSHGLATVEYLIPSGQGPGSLPIIATFPGQAPFQASSDSASLIVTRRP